MRLVQKHDTGHVYAMKILRKADMLEKEQVTQQTEHFVENPVAMLYFKMNPYPGQNDFKLVWFVFSFV